MLDFILGLIGTLLYPLFSVIFTFINGIQNVFYAFAGMGSITINGQTIGAGSGAVDDDAGLIYFLFQNNLVKNMLLSIMLLGLFLVIIFTVMAFIKNVYAAKQKSWKEIIGNAIKGLANFILVPVCCMFGVWLANILLVAINGATSNGGSSDMDRKLFIAAAYNSNEFRTGNKSGEDWEDLKTFAVSVGYSGADKIKSGLDNNVYAQILDDIYATCPNANIYWQGGVSGWYQVWSINYLVLLVGGIFMLYVLCSLAFAMVRRMFLLVILFIISPGVCAMYPLDEGKAVGSWKGEFIKLVLSAYGAVAGMNIFFSILPLIDQIKIYGTAGDISGLNSIIQIFMLVVGLLCVKEVIGLISNFVGGEDAYGKGAGLMKSTMDSVKKYRDKAAKVSSKFVGYAAPVAKGLGKGMFNIGKGAVTTVGKVGAAAGRGLGKVGAAAGRGLGKLGDKISNTKAGVAVRQGIFDAKQRSQERKERRAQTKEYKRMFDNIAEDEFLATPEGQAQLQKEWDKAERKHERQQRRAAFKRDYVDYYGGKAIGLAKNLGKGAVVAGKAVANSDFGKAVAEEAKKVPGGLKRFANATYAESGAEKWVQENIVKEYRGVGDRQADRDKKSKAGRAGTGKADKNLAGLEASVGVDAMSAQVIKALGDAIGTAVWRQKDLSSFVGKNQTFEDSKKALGLNDNSTIDDLKDVDGVISKLGSFASRMSNPNLDEVTKREILADAIKYARETDSNGNDKLQDALDEALKTFLQIDANKEVKIDKVTLDGTAAGEMIKASKEAAQAMAKYFRENMSKVAAAVETEQRNKK